MPRWFLRSLIVLALASFVPLALIGLSRLTPSGQPRLQIIWDMDEMKSHGSQSQNEFFADGRSMRPRIEGTIARGDLARPAVVRTGKDAEGWALAIPLTVDAALLERGRDRYAIFCAPCHGLSGNGDGMISRRARQLSDPDWVPPTDLHGEVVLSRKPGELFAAVRDGIRNMPPYGAQIPIDDSWAIVGWVKVLQRSQNATLEDLPANEREALR